MIKLSVVIITYNEERNIARCLSSLGNIADEIVVLDSFSTDATELICKSFNVKFHQQAFKGHIEQKNDVILLASNNYILSLDADEALSEQLISEIIKIKNNWQFDGYRINRLTNFCNTWIHHSNWYPDAKIRLFEKGKGTWQGVNPHDKFLLNPNCKLGRINADILHYSYPTFKEYTLQVEKFTDIASLELFKRKKKISIAKIIFNPLFTFIRIYFFKAGFLDGFAGYVIAKGSANSNFEKYVKLRMMYKENDK